MSTKTLDERYTFYIFVALLILLGTMVSVTFFAVRDIRGSIVNVEKAEASERAAWQKYDDAEEKHAEELEAARMANNMELWQAQQALAKCEGAKK